MLSENHQPLSWDQLQLFLSLDAGSDKENKAVTVWGGIAKVTKRTLDLLLQIYIQAASAGTESKSAHRALINSESAVSWQIPASLIFLLIHLDSW